MHPVAAFRNIHTEPDVYLLRGRVRVMEMVIKVGFRVELGVGVGVGVELGVG